MKRCTNRFLTYGRSRGVKGGVELDDDDEEPIETFLFDDDDVFFPKTRLMIEFMFYDNVDRKKTIYSIE